MNENIIVTTQKKYRERCWRCGRLIYIDPRGHIGCLNTKCKGYLLGAKRFDSEQLKPLIKYY